MIAYFSCFFLSTSFQINSHSSHWLAMHRHQMDKNLWQTKKELRNSWHLWIKKLFRLGSILFCCVGNRSSRTLIKEINEEIAKPLNFSYRKNVSTIKVKFRLAIGFSMLRHLKSNGPKEISCFKHKKDLSQMECIHSHSDPKLVELTKCVHWSRRSCVCHNRCTIYCCFRSSTRIP